MDPPVWAFSLSEISKKGAHVASYLRDADGMHSFLYKVII